MFANYFPSSWWSSWLSTLNSSLSLFGERKRFLYFCLFGKSEAWSALYVSRERLHIWTVWVVWRVTTISQVVTLSLLGPLSPSLSPAPWPGPGPCCCWGSPVLSCHQMFVTSHLTKDLAKVKLKKNLNFGLMRNFKVLKMLWHLRMENVFPSCTEVVKEMKTGLTIIPLPVNNDFNLFKQICECCWMWDNLLSKVDKQIFCQKCSLWEARCGGATKVFR